MIGFPGETHREVWESIRFIGEMAVLGVHDMSISPYSPYPGAELFRELQASGRIPEFTSDYFYSLVSYSDLTETISYNDHMSSRALGWYRIGVMVMFYALSFGVRPWRFVRMVRNLAMKRHESRLEMSLQALLQRVGAPRRHKIPIQM